MKYCILIGDGMADNPVPELNNETPLESAQTPFMDKLASKGIIGTVKTIPDGVEAGSDTAILNICGYDPRLYYSGRAPLEAAGADVHLDPSDTAYRCNMVSLDDSSGSYLDKKILSHNGGSIDGDSSLTLINDLLRNPKFCSCAKENNISIFGLPSFRHMAVQKNSDINGLVTIPPTTILAKESKISFPAAERLPTD
jgi:2,3-bisphosphoglycerate-independent phosphoglycerate mutase